LIYVPLDQALPEQRLVLAVRGGGDPSGLLPVIRQVFADVDPQLTLSTVGTGRSLASPTTLFFSIVAGITSLLGGFAWVVALAGLYGVLSQLVQRRTREIGVRMALGARRDQIVREVVVQGLRPAALGVTFGMALLVLTLTAVGSQFHFIDVSPDAATFLGVPTIFVFAAWLASYLPARRAASVDPVIALRDS
jgi:ABC-type antimicrobial peptide transport system permease subunit